MKKLTLLLAVFLSCYSLESRALELSELLKTVDPKPSAGRAGDAGGIYPTVKDADKYEAEGKNTKNSDNISVTYQGRNLNVTKSSAVGVVSTGGGLSKTVTASSKTNQDAQMENLESVTGEMVSKVEADRMRQSENYQDTFEKSRTTLADAYNITKDINVINLGKEQDPSVRSPFKCADITKKNCADGPNPHDIRECEEGKMLNWTGSEWKCYGIFETPNPPSCNNSTQKSVKENGGIACVDYIYQWGHNGWSACDANNQKSAIYSCFRKVNHNEKGVAVDDSNCKFLGEKPTAKTACSALYAAKIPTEAHHNFNPSLPRGWIINCSGGNLRLKAYRYSTLTYNNTLYNWRGGWLNINDARLFYGHSWGGAHCHQPGAFYCSGDGRRDFIYIASCFRAGTPVCPGGYHEYGSPTHCRKYN